MSGPPVFTIQLTGCPVAASRPRVTKYGTHNAPRYDRWKSEASLQIRRVWHHLPITMAVAISIDVTLPRPKTKPAPGTRHRAYYDPDLEYVAPLGGKWGDLDNYIKAVLDALQDGRVIQDDCQVVELTATKCVGDEVGLFIQVSVIEPAD